MNERVPATRRRGETARIHRNAAKVAAGDGAGEPVNWLGASFWSRAGGPLMWRSYDGGTVSEELRCRQAFSSPRWRAIRSPPASAYVRSVSVFSG